MPPKEFELYHGGPVQGRGKSFLENSGKLSIKMPDGSFKELGKIESADSLPIAENTNEKWWNGIGSSFSCTCEIKDTPESRKAMRELVESIEKSRIDDMIAMIRRLHRRGHYICAKPLYKYINRIVHKHYNMNFTRYCKRLGIRYFRGFRVRLESGCWVKRK